MHKLTNLLKDHIADICTYTGAVLAICYGMYHLGFAWLTDVMFTNAIAFFIGLIPLGIGILLLAFFGACIGSFIGFILMITSNIIECIKCFKRP